MYKLRTKEDGGFIIIRDFPQKHIPFDYRIVLKNTELAAKIAELKMKGKLNQKILSELYRRVEEPIVCTTLKS